MNKLNKHNLKIVGIINDSDRGHNGLLIKKDRTVVNDGRRLIEVINEEIADANHNDFIISKKAAEEALALAGDEEVIICQPTKDEVRFRVKTAGSEKIITTKPVYGEYPTYEEVYPKEDPIITIGFNPKYLAEIFTIICDQLDEDVGFDLVKLEFYSKDKPLKFSCEPYGRPNIQGVIMPMRLEENKEKPLSGFARYWLALKKAAGIFRDTLNP